MACRLRARQVPSGSAWISLRAEAQGAGSRLGRPGAQRVLWQNAPCPPQRRPDFMEHSTHAESPPRGLADFAREAGQGISAAFVLVAMMLPLGLIAFAPVGEYAVEAGLRAAFAAAIFGNL